MISPSILKGVISYLTSLNARTAVYDEDLNLQWSSCGEFFDSFDTKIISDVLPIKAETPITVKDGDTKSVMNVVPIYKSKRVVTAYICVLRDNYQIYNMMNHTSIADFTNLFLSESQDSISNIIGINKAVEDVITHEADLKCITELLGQQYKDAVKLYNEAVNNMTLSSIRNESTGNPNCNISALLLGICDEAAACLSKVKRKVITDIDARSYYAKIQYRDFVIAFTGLFRSQLCLSPLKSSIQVSSLFSDGDYCISIKTELLPENGMSGINVTKAQYERELARKIIISNCGGSFSFDSDGKSLLSTMRVPVVKKNRGAILNNKNAEYLSANYRPVHPFIDEIIEKENTELERIRRTELKLKKIKE